jgi:hypothetical protein
MTKNEPALDDVLRAINEGFSQVEQRIDALQTHVDERLDRLERIVDNWPPPSQIKDLLALSSNLKRRIEVLEQRVGLTNK